MKTILSIFTLLFLLNPLVRAQDTKDTIGLVLEKRFVGANNASFEVRIKPIPGHAGNAFIMLGNDTLQKHTKSWGEYNNDFSFSFLVLDLDTNTTYEVRLMVFEEKNMAKINNEKKLIFSTLKAPLSAADSKKKKKK